HATEVTDLLRVGHRTDRADPAVGDVERPGAEHRAGAVPQDRARLAVELARFDPCTGSQQRRHRGNQETRGLYGAERAATSAGDSTAVVHRGDVRSQHVLELLHVAEPQGVEEPVGELGTLASVRLETRLPGVHVAAGARGELTARGLGAA